MGMDMSLQVTSTPIILDISNTSNIRYLAEYTYTPVPGTGSAQSGLSSGAIAGIVVGCVAAVSFFL
jgi:hypothetical protein